MTLPSAFVSNWQTIIPVSEVTKVRSYFDLPAFSYTGLSWLGASEIITQFNYSASKNFVLKQLPTKPTGVNYCLCIRFRVGEMVFRYKLWKDVGEYLQAELYNNDIIKKNFVLEVWSTNGNSSVSQAIPIRFETSILAPPTDFYSPVTLIEEAVAAEFNSLNNVAGSYPAPTTNLVGKFDVSSLNLTGSTVNSWENIITGDTFVPTDPSNKPLKTTTGLNGLYGVAFTNILTRLTGPMPAGITDKFTIFMFIKPTTWANNSRIVQTDTSGSGFSFVAQRTSTPNILPTIDATDGITLTPLTLNTWSLLRISKDSVLEFLGIQIDEDSANSTLIIAANDIGSTLYFGQALFVVAEIFIYAAAATDELTSAMIQYFYNKYAYGINLPLTFNEGGPWLDNT